MIRLFWAAVFGVVEIFCLYSLVFFTSGYLPSRKPKINIENYTGTSGKDQEESYEQDIINDGAKRGSMMPHHKAVKSSFGMHKEIGKKEHWYKGFIRQIKITRMRLWVPSFNVFFWWWSLFNILGLVAIFIFWWQSNEDADSPPSAERFTMGYDFVLLLAVITRFLNSSWSMMFWGSVGNIWWLRIAFLEILAALAVSITALVYMYPINVLAFGFYLAFVVWEIVPLYYNGLFLRVCYDLRLNRNEHHKTFDRKNGYTYTL